MKNLVLINLLVISTVIVAPSAIGILQAPTVGERGYRYSNTINYQDHEYWISIESIDSYLEGPDSTDRIYHDIRQVNLVILGQNKEYHIIPVFKINETEIGPEYGNDTFWDFSLIKINTNFAYIGINVVIWQYTGLYGNNLTKHIQDFIIRFKYNSAINLDNLDSSLTSLQVINFQNMENVSLSETSQSEFYEGAFIGVFRDNRYYNDFWTYLRNDSIHDYLVVSQEVFGDMDILFTESETFANPTWKNIKGEFLDFGELKNFIIEDSLYDEFGEDLGLISMQSLKRANLHLVDSTGTFHFIGETLLINEAEGNTTGINQPEYLAINPVSGQFKFWDLFPSFAEFEAYPTMLDLGGGEVIMIMYGSVLNGFYDNPEYHPNFERTEEYDPLWKWYLDREVQVIRFNPLSPQNENYVQFDKSVSGTAAHTIEYPRPIGVQTIANTSANLGTATAVAIITGNNLYVFLQQYKTESGVAEEIYYGENGIMWTSIDLSIIAHSFDLTTSLNYTGYSKIIGPNEDIQDWYDTKGDEEDFEYPSLNGWDITSIETAFVTGDSIELYFHGYYDIIGDFARRKLHVININIEEDLA